ncbi:hypothetical protein V6N11_056045 [Hibiscus sabdariffa]|uniref:Uncharacterized protein n=1 Tax=Hibiscus sabdariffa TaxID=183260 RepID=A0ABR2T2N7_9ROSI
MSADGSRISVDGVPFCSRLAKHHPPSDVDLCFISRGIMGVELSHPIFFGLGRLSAEFQPSDIEETLMADSLQPIVFKSIIIHESLFLPNLFVDDDLGVSFLC